MDAEESRKKYAEHLEACNERERHDAALIQQVLEKHKLDSEESNASCHDLSEEQAAAVGRFLINRTSVGKFRKLAVSYLEWVASL